MCYKNNIPVVYAPVPVYTHGGSPMEQVKAMEAIAHPGQVGLRFTTVFGDGARDTMLMSRIANGTVKFATEHVRDLIYVEDVVSAIMIFIEQGTENRNATYEVGTGPRI